MPTRIHLGESITRFSRSILSSSWDWFCAEAVHERRLGLSDLGALDSRLGDGPGVSFGESRRAGVIGMAASGAKYGIMTSHFYWVGAIPAMVFSASL